MTRLSLVVLMMLSLGYSYAQVRPYEEESVYKEQVFLQVSESMTVVGDLVRVNAFVIDTKTEGFSKKSDVLHVRLVNAQSEIILQLKTAVQSGVSDFDFLIPPDLPGGVYQIKAYTQAMLNFKNNMGSRSIFVFNPYEAKPIVNSSSSQKKVDLKDFQSESLNLKLELKSNSFAQRSRVEVNLTNGFQEEMVLGVRISKVLSQNGNDATYWSLLANSEKVELNGAIPYEYKGELLRYKIIDEKAKAQKDELVAVSMSENPFELQFFKSDSNGLVDVFVDYLRTDNAPLIQIFGKNRLKYQLVEDPIDIPAPEFIGSSDWIMNRSDSLALAYKSVHNQIQNAYYQFRESRVRQIKTSERFSAFGNPELYVLSDFTRFPTVRETLIEIIPGAYLVKKRGGYQLNMRTNVENLKKAKSTLILLNGYLVQDLSSIASLSSNILEKVEVYRDLVQIGGQSYTGLINLVTFDRDMEVLPQGYFWQKPSLDPIRQSKRYFVQTYQKDDNTWDRIPDFRTLLFMTKPLLLKPGDQNFSFYTSDEKGVYQIEVLGFSQSGKRIRNLSYFEVK